MVSEGTNQMQGASTKVIACAAVIEAVERTLMIDSISSGLQWLEVIRRVMKATHSSGVPDRNVYLDPLAMTMADNTDSALTTLDVMRAIRQGFSDAHLTLELSNISLGLPARSYINRVFLTSVLGSSLDSAILDLLDHEMKTALVAAELALGHDQHCLN
jgi:5-methyltetrahydrofolate corrinoid/iron sulfur protein methyltransferase